MAWFAKSRLPGVAHDAIRALRLGADAYNFGRTIPFWAWYLPLRSA